MNWDEDASFPAIGGEGSCTVLHREKRWRIAAFLGFFVLTILLNILNRMMIRKTGKLLWLYPGFQQLDDWLL